MLQAWAAARAPLYEADTSCKRLKVPARSPHASLRPYQLIYFVSCLAALLLACQRPSPKPSEGGASASAPHELPLERSAAPSAHTQPSSSPKLASDAPRSPEEIAKDIAERILILDSHIDLPYRIWLQEQLGEPTLNPALPGQAGHFDYEKATRGKLDAAFISIYVAARYEGGGALAEAERQLDLIEQLLEAHPDKFVSARSPKDIREHFNSGKIALPLGLENAAPLAGKLSLLEYLKGRGVRYITLAHSRDNHVADSSYDSRKTNRGLSPFGRQVVSEMNRLGLMIDVSHLSDQATSQVLALSKAPIIATHSGCRHFTPGFARNLSDELILGIAKSGGVIGVNFGSNFLDDETRKYNSHLQNKLSAQARQKRLVHGSAAYTRFASEFWRAHPAKRASIEQVVRHIDHIVKLAGEGAVAFGSDFDGVGDTLPLGLQDVSGYPKLIEALYRAGYSEDTIERFASGNLLRAWEQIERQAESALAH